MSLANNSKTNRTFHYLREKLLEIYPIQVDELTSSARFDRLIAADERRRVWQKLREAGFDLPELTLSSRVFLAAALIVMAPVALLAYFLNWTVVLSLAELGLLARKVTRPLAIYPPIGCETVQEAVLHLTPFRQEDYKAGLWPREDIAAKVRWITARAAGLPFETVTNETRLLDILGC
jgi:hypothetical protein